MVADPHENRRPRNLTAAEMAAQFHSRATNKRPARQRFDFSQLCRSVSAPRLNNVGATQVASALASLLWRWPAAMWNRFWTASQNSGLRCLAFAPWILAVVAPVALEILQDIASWVPPEPTSGLEAVPLFSAIPTVTALLMAQIDSVLLHFTGLEAFLWWPLLVIVFAYIGTGPIHVMGASRRAPSLDSHGSAAWGTSSDAIKGGHLLPQGTSEGLMLGHVDLPRGEKKKRDKRYRVFSHVLTFAGTGRGKGIGAAIPNLLVYPGSTFSVDPKAEQYEVTARARMELGFQIARLDPFCGTGKPSHSFNWLDAIDPDHKSCVAESAQLANAIVVRAGKDPHWDRQATFLLQGLILHVATLPQQERHMGTVRDLLMLGTEDLRTLLGTLSEDKTRGCGLIAKTGTSFLGKDSREAASILSSAQGHTAFLDDPQILDTLKRSDFSLADLKTKRLSIYLVIPAEHIGPYAGYIRALLVLALAAMTKNKKRTEHPVLFMVDECGQLDYVAALERGISILRGFGVVLWLFFQDMGQLIPVYPKWKSLLGNATSQVFGLQDLDTAKYFSAKLGKKTVRVETSGSSTSTHNGRGSHGQSRNESYTARDLMTHDELCLLPSEQVVVLQSGERPMLLKRIDYRTDPEFMGMAAPNSMYS